ncbi:hypothetical protein GCK32_007953 [Trichostrongylus colubriformis]|uniref:Polyprotein allergen nematode domain-containing protein n=1 Tax=Trichostrongylus colubriformis TaxID=6319 RepID=A0AAN8FUB3_TRICO
MKDSGATNEALAAKIDEFIAAIPEKEKKEKAERVAASCKKVYALKSRMRRDYYMDSYEIHSRALRYLSRRRRENQPEIHFLDI